jgi:NADH-quinone oxidoreductase subunit E
MSFSPSLKKNIDHWIQKFPEGKQQAALLATLRLVQEENKGHLDDASLKKVAEYLDLPLITVYEVATFYTLYHLKPMGRHCLYVCTNISCMLCDSDKIVARLEEKLGISMGETTPDGRISLIEVECLGACGGAPALQVGTTYHESMTVEKIDRLLEELH